MELNAQLFKNYPSEVDGVLSNGDGCLHCQIFKWGEDPMVSVRFFGLFLQPMTSFAGGVV